MIRLFCFAELSWRVQGLRCYHFSIDPEACGSEAGKTDFWTADRTRCALFLEGETDMAGKYLVVYKGVDSIPRHLQIFVKQSIAEAFKDFNLEFDFSGRKSARDLVVNFSDEIPVWSVFGESSRMSINDVAAAGESTVYVGVMKAMRLQTSGDRCVAAFPSTKESLGMMIANTAIHETAHMLDLDTGGYDGGGHVAEKDNYLWMSKVKHKTRVGEFFEYTVQQGDTLSSIVSRFKTGRLHPCRRGPTALTYSMVWQLPKNKEMGFIAHPTKSGHRGRRANSPHWIYPGEKVALMDTTLRTEKYRMYYPGWLGKKKFSDGQAKAMKDFIERRLAAGKG